MLNPLACWRVMSQLEGAVAHDPGVFSQMLSAEPSYFRILWTLKLVIPRRAGHANVLFERSSYGFWNSEMV